MAKVKLVSFGYKHGNVPEPCMLEGIRVYDVRKTIRNPWNVPELKALTGLDQKVQDYIKNCKGTRINLYWLRIAIIPFKIQTVYIGCTGGQHRSVALVEMAAKHLKEVYPDLEITIEHRDLPSQVQSTPSIV